MNQIKVQQAKGPITKIKINQYLTNYKLLLSNQGLIY